jgi:sulfate adenylyltransferase
VTDLFVTTERAAELGKLAVEWPSVDLEPRQVTELELLLSAGIPGVTGYLGSAAHDSVLSTGRLPSGEACAYPFSLDVRSAPSEGGPLLLRDPEGLVLAVLTVTEIWQGQPGKEVSVLGPDVHRHPVRLAGPVEGLAPPPHLEFPELRDRPARLADQLSGCRPLALVTDRPLHRADVTRIRSAVETAGADTVLLLAGQEAQDAVPYTLVRTLLAVAPELGMTASVHLLPLPQMAPGPWRTLLHAQVAAACGAAALLREHGAPAAAAAVATPADVGVTELDPPPAATLSEAEISQVLRRGEALPAGFTPPAVEAVLRRANPPRLEQGVVVFFTGLSGSGKSTIAQRVAVLLRELDTRRVTLLDGDVVRKHLSSGLGFSRDDRDTNVRRIGWVAAQIAGAGGAVVAAPIAPYAMTRAAVRQMARDTAGFVLVHVATPLEVCEARDRKGLYAKARAGLIPEFTGISDPYEAPDDAEIVVDTQAMSADEAARHVVDYLREAGYLTYDD